MCGIVVRSVLFLLCLLETVLGIYYGVCNSSRSKNGDALLIYGAEMLFLTVCLIRGVACFEMRRVEGFDVRC